MILIEGLNLSKNRNSKIGNKARETRTYGSEDGQTIAWTKIK